MATELDQRAARFIVDMGLARGIVHGGQDETINTEGGPVDSLAKTVKDMKSSFEAGVGGIFNTVVGGYAAEAKTAKEQVDASKQLVEAAAELAVRTVEDFTFDTDALLAAAGQAVESAGEATSAAQSAEATRTAYEDLVYPGVYAVPPTQKPHSGAPCAVGDRCVMQVGGVTTDRVFNGALWIIPNPDAANLAQSGGSALVGSAARFTALTKIRSRK